MYKTLKSLLTITCLATSFSAMSMEIDLGDLMAQQQGQTGKKSLYDIFTERMPNGDLIFAHNITGSLVHKTNDGSNIQFSFAVEHPKESAELTRLTRGRFDKTHQTNFDIKHPTIAIDSEVDKVIGRFLTEFGIQKGVKMESRPTQQRIMANYIMEILKTDKCLQKYALEALQNPELKELGISTPADVYRIHFNQTGEMGIKHEQIMGVLNKFDDQFSLVFALPNCTSKLTLTIRGIAVEDEVLTAMRLPEMFSEYTTEIATFMDAILHQAFQEQYMVLDQKSAHSTHH